VVQNGLGYDSFMNTIESGLAQRCPQGRLMCSNLLGLPDSTPNPHLWYDPRTMPAVAKGHPHGTCPGLRPRAQGPTSRPGCGAFITSLQPWRAAIAQFPRQVRRHPGWPPRKAGTATNLLQALGAQET